MKLLTRILSLLILTTGVAGCSTETDKRMQPIKVEVVERDGGYQLLRGGKPYTIKGAGIAGDDLEAFAATGGNSFRTWSVDQPDISGSDLLDKAHSLGLTVSLCLPLMRERHGFDYDDPVAVAEQLEQARAYVTAHKDHPALLTWIIGNELNHDYTNENVWNAVNDVARMIHEVDPNHPATTALAGFGEDVIAAIEERAPDLDFLSFQVYGKMFVLPEVMEQAGFDAPYFITEWGAIGHWEMESTTWGAPIEQTSSQKAATYARAYNEVLKPNLDQAIGNYVFLWGQKQERTPTWYGLFLKTGETTEAVDVMYKIWNGEWPPNRSPTISPVTLNEQSAADSVMLSAGETYPASIEVTDHDRDALDIRWELHEESKAKEVGGDLEVVPPLVEGVIGNQGNPEITLTAPVQSGAYRLFVYVYDGNNHAAHANIPLYVE